MRIAPPHSLCAFSSLSLLLALVYAPAVLINWYQSVGVRGVRDARVRRTERLWRACRARVDWRDCECVGLSSVCVSLDLSVFVCVELADQPTGCSSTHNSQIVEDAQQGSWTALHYFAHNLS